MRPSLAAAGLALALAAGCTSQLGPDDAALCRAYAAKQSHVEVVVSGRVTRDLGVQQGRVSPHEGFLMRLDSGCDAIVRVEANADFTGTFALAAGQPVTVKGEYEYYPRGGVIHWTHRDPRGRHEGGYVETGGRHYD